MKKKKTEESTLASTVKELDRKVQQKNYTVRDLAKIIFLVVAGVMIISAALVVRGII